MKTTDQTLNLSIFAENPDNPSVASDDAIARLMKKLRKVPDGLKAHRIAYVIANSTNRGDIVLDPFAGSGTTALACARLDRRAWLAEISPHYCDVIRRRYAESLHGTGCDWLSLTPEVPIHDNP